MTETLMTVPTGTREQIKAYAECLFSPRDIVEVRALLNGQARKFWTTADKLADMTEQLCKLNEAGWNIYAGVNPRKGERLSGDGNVKLCRALFCDFDHIDHDGIGPSEIIWSIIEDAGLPQPTLTASSGHGTHCYWVLNQALEPDGWSKIQARLNERLGADRTIKNPERIMRIAGLQNLKEGMSPSDCFIVDIDIHRRYDLSEIESQLPEVKEEPPQQQPKRQGEKSNYNTLKARAVLYADKWPGVAQGERNSMAMHHAADLQRDFALSPDDARDILSGWNAGNNPPLSESELELCLANGLKYGKHQVGEKLDKPKRKRTAAHAGPDGEDSSGQFHLSDAGNGERLAARHGGEIRYCWDLNKWLYYDGKRWNAEIGAEKANSFAIETARSIAIEANGYEDREKRGKFLKWSFDSESSARLAAMLQVARSIQPVPVYSRQFNKDAWLINCPNATVNLRKGEKQPHDPADMITMLSPAIYDPTARLDLWDNFLDTVTGGDKELQNFLQKIVGHSLTGDVGLEFFYFIHGPAATGKTTFIESVKSVLGDYAHTADFETFLKRPPQGGILRNDVACLSGKRLVASIEVDEGRRIAAGLVKMLTGGDSIRARFLYQESFEFVPTFKIWLVANHEPKIPDDDSALWRRVIKIPFTNEIPEKRRDPAIKAKLRDPTISGPAILAWAVRGCLKWQEEGLKIPKIVEDATEQYRISQDPLGDFYEELLFEPAAYVPIAEMRGFYESYLKENGIKFSLSPRHFNERLEARGCERKSMRVVNDLGTERVTKCWLGVTISSSPKKVEPEFIQDEIPF